MRKREKKYEIAKERESWCMQTSKHWEYQMYHGGREKRDHIIKGGGGWSTKSRGWVPGALTAQSSRLFDAPREDTVP